MNLWESIILESNLPYKFFSVNNSMILWCYYTEEKVIVLENESILCTIEIENGSFFYKEGMEKILIFEKYEDSTIFKSIDVNTRIIEKQILPIFLGEIYDIVNVNDNKFVVIQSENGNFLLGVYGDNLVQRIDNIFFDFDKNYLLVDVENRKMISIQENFPFGYNLITTNREYQVDLFDYKNDVIAIVKNKIGNFNLSLINYQNNSLLYRSNEQGYVVDLMLTSDYVIQVIIDKAISIIKLTNLQTHQEKIIFESAYRISIENIRDDMLIFTELGFHFVNLICYSILKHEITIIKLFNEKIDFKIYRINTQEYKATILSKNINSLSDKVLISFHGGPESVELLDNRYGKLYSSLLKKGIDILVFNYPGTVSFDYNYQLIPKLNWKNCVNHSLEKMLSEIGIKNRKIILIGGSFGATLALLVDNTSVSEKIVLNPLTNLNSHSQQLNENYVRWFNDMFSSKDYDYITMENINKINKEILIHYIIGESDEIINHDDLLNEEITNSKHSIYIDDGSHDGNKSERVAYIIKLLCEK